MRSTAILAGVVAWVLGFICPVVAMAEGVESAALPAGGVAVIDGPLRTFARPEVPGTAEVSEAGGVYTAKVTRQPRYAWDVGASRRSAIAVEKDDVLAVEFTASGRGMLTAEGSVTVVFEGAGPPHDKSLDATVSVGATPRRYVFPFTAHRAFAAGGGQVSIRFGGASQEVTLSGVRVVSYGKRVKLADLPITRLTYANMEQGAPWRAEALARIERIRKGDLTVRVTDAAGKPVAGAEVKVEMTRHAYQWGTAVPARRLFDESADGVKFREVLLSHFNYATLENDLKWGSFRSDPETARRGVAWLREKGLAVRGHNLIWPGWRDQHFFPRDYRDEYLKRKATDPEGAKAWLRELCRTRILDATRAFAGQLRDWDVINETYANHDVQDELGREVIVEWFKIAREGDPQATLYLNDYGILEGGGSDRRHIDFFFDEIKYIQDRGGPIGGVGIQGHWGSNLTDPVVMLQILDRFATLGLPIQITEFDVNIADEETQAAFTRDVLITIFSHPATDAFIMWGFWEKSHWMPKGAMYRGDWSEKPNAKVYREWVLGKWWTRETTRTGEGGEAKVRGFAGEYDVSVTLAGKTTRKSVRLPARGVAEVAVEIGR